MLPSGIRVSDEARPVLPSHDQLQTVSGTSGTARSHVSVRGQTIDASAQPPPAADVPVERGPLARAVMRVLGIGGYQAFAGWAENRLQRVFGGTDGVPGTPRQLSWLAARVLATPTAFYRAHTGALHRSLVTREAPADAAGYGPFTSMARLAYERSRQPR